MIQLIEGDTVVDFGGMLLKVNQNIDYKPTGENKIAIGKITQFIKAPESESIWAYVTEVQGGEKDCISLTVWHDYYKAGLFSNKTTETLIDASDIEEVTDDLPF